MNCQSAPLSAMPESRSEAPRPPLVLPRLRRRPRRARPGRPARAGRPRRAGRRRPAGAEGAALTRRRPSASSTCSWPAPRAIWNCSTTSRSWPSSTARCRRPTAQGLPRRLHQSQLEAARPEVQVRQARQVRRGAVRIAAAPGRRWSTTSPSSSRWSPTPSTTPRPRSDEHRLAAVRPAELRRLDALRPGQRVARPARLRRLQLRQEGAERRQLQLGQRLPAHRLPGRAVPQRRRSGAVPVQPAGRRRRAAARLARRRRSAQPACASTRSATRRSPRASTRSRWPTGCRPAPRS